MAGHAAHRLLRRVHPFATVTSGYLALNSEADYREAIDGVIGLATREILIFDRDLVRLQIDTPARIDKLKTFLALAPYCRLRIILHDSGPAERDMSRLQNLLRTNSHAIECRQIPDNLRHLADAHIIADTQNGVRRFHADHARSALITLDEAYLQPWRKRFEDLWELSAVCLTGTISGL